MIVRLPIRVRLTAIFAALTTVVLVGTGSFVYLRFGAGLDEEINRGLQNQAQTIVEALGQSDLLPEGDSVLVAPTEPIAQIYSSSGALTVSRGVAGETRLLPVTALARMSGQTLFEAEVPTSQEIIEARLLAVDSGQGSIVVVGSPLTARNSALDRLSLLLLIVGPLALLVTTVIGWRLAGGALRPVEDMRAEAASITSTDPQRRLSVPVSGDEVARLGTTLNEMLDRLEEALARERRFVDDASHELRTPLTTLRMELELALRRSRTREELQAALTSAHEESDRLGRLAEDLLVLARVEHGRLPVRRVRVDVAELISELRKTFDERAARSSVKIEELVTLNGPVELDPERIHQALTNLLDNALRYTPTGGTISIHAVSGERRLELSVTDTGPGFPEDFLARAFEPFARPDGARGRDTGGTGLGLTIVMAVAESHGGTAIVHNPEGGGAAVTLQIPT